MEKFKSHSFYFSKNFINKYFIFVFAAVVFFTNGFFISTVYAQTDITDDIFVDTHWGIEGSPYILSSIYIDQGVTLTIDPGVVIKMNEGSSLYTRGDIIANGTLEEPIYFTSNYDDTVGGSTDDFLDCYFDSYDEEGNGIGKEICEDFDYYDPMTGDWGGVYMNLSTGSSFKNIYFRYAEDALIFESASGNIENLNINDSVYGVTLYNSADVSISNANIDNLEKDAFVIFINSKLKISNGDITNVENGLIFYTNSYFSGNDLSIDCRDTGIIAYIDSTLDLSNINITSNNVGVTAYMNTVVNISNGNISSINKGLEFFNEVKANISGLRIENAEDTGVLVYNNTNSDIKFTKNEITNNNYGFIVFNSPIFVNQNSIHDNTIKGAETFGLEVQDLDFSSNYWGDKTGPTHSSNVSGLGDTISDHILYSPFLLTDPLINVRNPVILIPGITGSYLFKDYGDKGEIWPSVGSVISSLFDLFLKNLSLNKDGTENIEYPIRVGDIIRGISSVGIHVFDNFIQTFVNDGYIEGKDLFVFPYDWRMSTAKTAELLKQKIDEIILSTGESKVDIVAHSMGGLIAKKYIKDNGGDMVDQLVFLGTPQLGSPKAFKTLMFGDSMGYEKFNIPLLRPIIAKEISQNMPSVYELLPSEKYIKENGSYVINALLEIIDGTISKGLDYKGVKDLMIQKGRNELMFPFAESLHNSIDDLDLSGIRSYNFVGCGSKTIGEVRVYKKRAWEKLWLGYKDDYDLKYVNGDETVPFVSSTRTIGSEMFYVNGISHGSLPSEPSVSGGILSILNDKGVLFNDVLKDNDSYCGVSGSVVSVHSPVELHIYDEENNHTGPDKNGDIEYGMNGVVYDVIEGEKYAFLPDGINYKIVTKATDIGGYDFKIEQEDNNDNITNTYEWTLIPLITLDTKGEIWIGPDYPVTEYQVGIDNEGDGKIDQIYRNSYDGTKEAEKIINKNKKDHKIFGSMSYIFDKDIKKEEYKKDNIFENFKDKEEDKYKNKMIPKRQIEIFSDKKEIYINRDDILYASAGSIDLNKNYIWPIYIFSIIILIILGKKFIK